MNDMSLTEMNDISLTEMNDISLTEMNDMSLLIYVVPDSISNVYIKFDATLQVVFFFGPF